MRRRAAAARSAPAPFAAGSGLAFALAAALAVAGCATAPPLAGAPEASPPPHAVGADAAAHRDRDVLWGGMVIETRNFERHSEIELLAFPLDARQAPQPEAADLGRFVLLRAGFLDPGVYAPGRFLSATGRITGERHGHIREAEYRWPELDASAMHLWPRDFRERQSNVQFSIGIGVFR